MKETTRHTVHPAAWVIYPAIMLVLGAAFLFGCFIIGVCLFVCLA